MLKVGLRTENASTMYNLSVSLAKSKKESRHDLIESINLLIDLIKQGTRLEESFFDDLLYLNSSVNKTAWRQNSKGEFFYDFNLIKKDYDLHYLFLQSINYKRTSAAWNLRIIERYKLLQKQIEDLLRELD